MDFRTPLIMVGGLLRPSVRSLSMNLLRTGTVVVHHDLRNVAEGVVERRVDFRSAQGIRREEQTLELAHGCISCTLREDVLPLLRALADRPEVDRIVLQLDPALEPETVSWCLPNVLLADDTTAAEAVRIEAIISILHASSWLSDATGDVPLHELGLAAAAEDERNLAQLVISQAEMADVIVLSGHAEEPWAQVRTHAVLDRVAPGVPRIHVPAGVEPDPEQLLARVPEKARRGAVYGPFDPLLPGGPPLDSDCGVALTLLSDARPFHPGRLHDALGSLLEGTVRIRGRLWLAGQPDSVLWLESSGGGARIGNVGRWLAGGEDWRAVDAERAAMAALAWHPRFGDRRQEIAVVAHDLGADAVTEALAAALLTPAELAAEDEWPAYADPFAERHVDPCGEQSPLTPERKDERG